MPKVNLNPDRQSPQDIERALRQLKKSEDKCLVLKTLRQKEGYEKPTTMRKRKAASAKARHKRDLDKAKLPEKLY